MFSELNRQPRAISPTNSSVENVVSAMPYRIIEKEVAVDRIRWCQNPEWLATLLRENPALASIRSGGGIYLVCRQFSLLKPEMRGRLQPAFALISVGSMSIGFTLSALSISFAKADNFFARRGWDRKRSAKILEHTNRTWMAFIDGICSVLPSVLTEIIIAYCSNPNHWNDQNQCMVSDQIFLKKFIPGPLTVALIYTIWNSIPFQVKSAWIKTNKCICAITYAVDLSLSTVLYSRYIQTFIQDLGLIIEQASIVTKITQSPNLAISEAPAIGGALTALVLQALKPRYKESIITLMTYFYSVVVLLRLSSDIVMECKYGKEPDGSLALPWAIIKILGFGTGILAGSILTALWSRTFVKEWVKIKQYVRVDSAYMLQRQMHDGVREQVRQQIIAELQQEEVPLRNDVLNNNEQKEEEALHAFDSSHQHSAEVNLRLARSVAQLEQASIGSDPEHTPDTVGQGEAILTSYRQQLNSGAEPLVQSELPEPERPNASFFQSLKFSKCTIM